MYAYCVETSVQKNHSLKLEKLPFQEGDIVEVIILKNKKIAKKTKTHSLKHKVLKYTDPMEPVAELDWKVLQ